MILNEPLPEKYIKRLCEVKILPLIIPNVTLNKEDFRVFAEVKRTIAFYRCRFKHHRRLEEWLIYLMAILRRSRRFDAVKFLDTFGFRKGEKIRVLSVYENIDKVRQLNKKVPPHVIYKMLNPLSFENIIFFYACYKKIFIRKISKFSWKS